MEEGVEEADLTNLITSLQSTSDTLDRLLEGTVNSGNNIVVTGTYEPYEQLGGSITDVFALAKSIEKKVYTLEDRLLASESNNNVNNTNANLSKGGGRRRQRSTRRRQRRHPRT